MYLLTERSVFPFPPVKSLLVLYFKLHFASCMNPDGLGGMSALHSQTLLPADILTWQEADR